jgi:hypothetical protein
MGLLLLALVVVLLVPLVALASALTTVVAWGRQVTDRQKTNAQRGNEKLASIHILITDSTA